ncbi:MAG TPA: hypothetical protein VK660_10780 [Xanthomonadaceae bacterium]|nr:hypothetical protein [Xanthomonadaceae bacterium]
MKTFLVAGLLAALLAPAAAFAQSAFDGTWKIDLGKVQMPRKPSVYLLQNGKYECKTCVPPISVKADGSDQKVSGHPYFDSVAVKIVDDRTIEEIDKKEAKVVATSSTTVAADGKTATFEFSDSSNSSSAAVTGKGTMTRVDKGPAGSHPISGSWRTTSFDTVSDNGLLFTYKVDGDKLSMTTPTGQSYSAKMDGTDSPFNGDPGTTSVSVKKIGKNVVRETDKRDGKVISVSTMTLGSDGKSMTIGFKDMLRGTSSSYVATKQ